MQLAQAEVAKDTINIATIATVRTRAPTIPIVRVR